MSTQEVARRLEVSEATVKKYERDGLLERAGRRSTARGQPILFTLESIKRLERARLLGSYGRSTRRILIHEQVSSEIVLALTTAGLHCATSPTLLGVIGEHEGGGMPIIVVPAKLEPDELGLLDTVITKVYCIVIGAEAPNERVRRRCTVIDQTELRRLVQVAWSLVDSRLRQTQLEL